MVPQLQILHDCAQPAHPKSIARRLGVRGTFHRGIVEALLRLAPVRTLREIGPEEARVDAAKVAFGDVRLEDVGLDEEDVAELADELEALVQGGDREGVDDVLVRLEVLREHQAARRTDGELLEVLEQ